MFVKLLSTAEGNLLYNIAWCKLQYNGKERNKTSLAYYIQQHIYQWDVVDLGINHTPERPSNTSEMLLPIMVLPTRVLLSSLSLSLSLDSHGTHLWSHCTIYESARP